jgi:hypothetical protein
MVGARGGFAKDAISSPTSRRRRWRPSRIHLPHRTHLFASSAMSYVGVCIKLERCLWMHALLKNIEASACRLPDDRTRELNVPAVSLALCISISPISSAMMECSKPLTRSKRFAPREGLRLIRKSSRTVV